MKIKRHIATPLILLIYLIFMAIYSYPRYQAEGNWTEYYLVVGGTLAILVVLFFMLKRREKFRNERKNANKKKINSYFFSKRKT